MLLSKRISQNTNEKVCRSAHVSHTTHHCGPIVVVIYINVGKEEAANGDKHMLAK